MIEREFIREKAKYLKVKEYLDAQVGKQASIGSINIEKTPLGEKISIEAARPGIIIGRAGKTITDLTHTLKVKFKMENPQIEVREVSNPQTNASVISKKIASDLEKFGPARFKAIGHKALDAAMRAGALGIEIRIGGRGVPGQRAASWLFSAGYMKKSGQMAIDDVDKSTSRADLRSGAVGIQVRVMPPNMRLPDKITILEVPLPVPSVETMQVPAKDEQAPPVIAEPAKKRQSKKKPSTSELPKADESSAKSGGVSASANATAQTPVASTQGAK